jgi:hypothetical protein
VADAERAGATILTGVGAGAHGEDNQGNHAIAGAVELISHGELGPLAQCRY